MRSSFGPWTSSMQSAGRLRLSGFWKKRMALLPHASRCRCAASGAGVALALAALCLAVPLLTFTIEQPASAATAAEATAGEAAAEETMKLPGSIYLTVWIYRSGQLRGLGVARIDPRTGRWKLLLDEKLLDQGLRPRVAPDGQTIAWIKGEEIWSADTDMTANPGKLASFPGIPVWSPDGREIIATHAKPLTRDNADRPSSNKDAKSIVAPQRYKYETWKFDAGGGNQVPVPLPEGHNVDDWSSDGKWLLTDKGHGIVVVRTDGSGARQIVKRGYNPRFSPDGKQIVFNRGWGDGGIYVAGLDGGRERCVYKEGDMEMANAPCFSPNGTHVSFITQQLSLSNGQKSLNADPSISQPRLMIMAADGTDVRELELPEQDEMQIHPAGAVEWR